MIELKDRLFSHCYWVRNIRHLGYWLSLVHIISRSAQIPPIVQQLFTINIWKKAKLTHCMGYQVFENAATDFIRIFPQLSCMGLRRRANAVKWVGLAGVLANPTFQFDDHFELHIVRRNTIYEKGSVIFSRFGCLHFIPERIAVL